MTNYLLITSLLLGIFAISMIIILIYEIRTLVKSGSNWLDNYPNWQDALISRDGIPLPIVEETIKPKEEDSFQLDSLIENLKVPEVENILPIKSDSTEIDEESSTKEKPEVFTRLEAATYLGIKYYQIPMTLPSHKRKGKLYYHKDDLDNYIAKLSKVKMKFPQNKLIFNRNEAATYLGRSYFYLSRIPKNTLPFYKEKRSTYYTRNNLDLYREIYLTKENKNA